jgi:hypothetical protein
MSRFWPDGVPIVVTTDTLATPIAFRWGAYRHAVEQIVDRWRVDAGWWQRRVWREYFQLTTTSGLLLLIYHDVRAGEWRLQRLYD